MHKKKLNRFDVIVDKMSDEFAQIPNFELLSQDEKANEIFNSIVYRISEIDSYKKLVLNGFVPAITQMIRDEKADVAKSKYKRLIDITKINFDDTLNDTIRFAYVALFHKLENYIKIVKELPLRIYDDLINDNKSVSTWAKEKFQFDIEDWQQFKITQKINWISNCVKHKDGYPVKIPIPIEFTGLDQNKKILLSVLQFKHDAETLLDFYPKYLQLINAFASHKLMVESNARFKKFSRRNEIEDSSVENVKASVLTVEENINKIISLLKEAY